MAEKLYIENTLIGTVASEVEYANSGLSGVSNIKGAMDNIIPRVQNLENNQGSGDGGGGSSDSGVIQAQGLWLLLGDSVTWYDKQGMTAYPTIVSQKINFTGGRVNKAISGAMVSGSNGGVSQITSYLEAVQQGTQTAASYVTIAFGSNDFGFGLNIGTISDFIADNYNTATHTFYNAMREIINKIYVMNPLAKIIMITPRKCDGGAGSTTIPEHWYDQKANGRYFQDYVDAIVEIAHYMSYPICDWWNESQSNSLTMQSLARAENDLPHPNVEGHKRLAAILIETFKKVII